MDSPFWLAGEQVEVPLFVAMMPLSPQNVDVIKVTFPPQVISLIAFFRLYVPCAIFKKSFKLSIIILENKRKYSINVNITPMSESFVLTIEL